MWPLVGAPGSTESTADGWPLTGDQRAVIDARGEPDSFTVVGVGGDPDDPGHNYRMEAWHYHGDRVTVVFVDGADRGTRDLDWPEVEPGPTTDFHPEDFALGMAVAQVEAMVFGGGSTGGFEFADDSQEYQAVSHQALQLGFEDGVLVYVDTSPDLPEDAWPGGE